MIFLQSRSTSQSHWLCRPLPQTEGETDTCQAYENTYPYGGGVAFVHNWGICRGAIAARNSSRAYGDVSTSAFAIAGAQEVSFYQKLHRPVNQREVTDAERNAAYQQAISDELSFVESQRNRVVTLTEQQRRALITLLLSTGVDAPN